MNIKKIKWKKKKDMIKRKREKKIEDKIERKIKINKNKQMNK